MNPTKVLLGLTAAALALSPLSAIAAEVNSRTFNEFSRGTYGEWGHRVTNVEAVSGGSERYHYDAGSSALKVESGHINGLDVYIKNKSYFSEEGSGHRYDKEAVSIQDVVTYDGYNRTYGIEAESGAGN